MFFNDELNVIDEAIISFSTDIGVSKLLEIKLKNKEIVKHKVHDSFFIKKILTKEYCNIKIKEQLVEETIINDYNSIKDNNLNEEMMLLEDHCNIYIRNIEGE